MGRRPGSHHKSCALAALLALAFLSGCANSAWYAASPSQGSSAGIPPGGSVRVVGVNTSGAWLGFGILLGAVYGPYFQAVPEMNPERRVIEQDCSKPIEDLSANLRCR
jgi:hypothetical protein